MAIGLRHILSLVFVVSSLSHAAISRKPDGDLIFKYEKMLKAKEQEYRSIELNIKSLEHDIADKNQRYIEGISITKRIMSAIDQMEDKLSTHEKDIGSVNSKIKDMYSKYLLNSMDENSPELVYENRVLAKALKYYTTRLQALTVLGEDLGNRQALLKARYEEYNGVEQILYSLVTEMENKKKVMAETYVESLKQKEEIETKLSELITTSKCVATNSQLGSPIINFISAKRVDKGVNFEFKGPKAVYAVSTGKVVYVGSLASYGNVIMMDHGSDLRSVLLGDFVPAVKLNDQISRGAIVARTVSKDTKSDSVYFELRKKNIAQNVVSWLDKSIQIRN